MTWVLLVALALVAVVGIALISLRHRNPYQVDLDTKVDAFRRHMDALSPAARREVIDRVRASRVDPEG